MKKTTVCNDAIPLPDPPNPHKTICVTLEIPDNLGHMAAFMGALYNLGINKTWERDIDHSAIEVSRLWKTAYDTVRFGCGNDQKLTYEEYTDMPAFREDCDCNLFYKCCDGTEKKIAIAADVPPPPSAPGAGTPQPAPGGGTQKYCQTMSANDVFLIGAPLNTGDTLTIEASGSGNDGGEVQWRCPDGSTYFAGFCNQSEVRLDGADPVPTVNHMALIINIAGTYYSLGFGTYTVPGGVSNAQAFLQVNDSDIANNRGGYQICATVTNNQVVSWSHEFDFVSSDGGWQQIMAPGDNHIGAWTPGVGWTQTQDTNLSGNSRRGAVIKRLFASATITSVSMLFDYAIGTTNAPGDVAQGGYDNAGTLFQNDYTHAVVGINLTLSSGSITHTDVEIDLALKTDTNIGGGTGGFTGSCVIKKVIVTGVGFNPFA